MTIELTLQVFFTFRRHTGLYFWSILVCTWGVTFHVFGVILKLYNESNWIVSSVIFKIGWVGNVTGFSLVLYSRLNLVVHDRRIRRAVLAMIIIDAFLMHTPIIIFDFGISSPHPNIWYMPMHVYERIQVIWFSVQETIISFLYIWHTRDFLRHTYSHQTHRVMALLITAQVVAVIFDIALITLDWENMFLLKIVIHPFCYAVKLKFEFIVLNQLLALIKHGINPSSFPAPDEESPVASGPRQSRPGIAADAKQSSIVSSVTAADGLDSGVDISRRASVFLPSGVLERDMEYYNNRSSATYGDSGNIGRVEYVANSGNKTISPELSPNLDLDAIERLPRSSPPHTPLPPAHVPAAATVSIARSSRPTSFEPHLPVRSFSDPMPLTLTQSEMDTESIVAEIERHYLGRWNG